MHGEWDDGASEHPAHHGDHRNLEEGLRSGAGDDRENGADGSDHRQGHAAEAGEGERVACASERCLGGARAVRCVPAT